MHYSLPTKSDYSKGFTLVEILIIAPIVVLIIGTFIGFITSMVGDVLANRDQNTLVYETQSALNRIEQDTRLSTQFLTTTGALTAPQGSDNNFTGTAAFTNTSNTLALTSLTTDQNPESGARSLVYYANQPNACGTTQTHNRALLSTVVYFINGTTLWRRTILPTYDLNSTVDATTVCSTPWQLNSCSPGYTLTRCKTNDEQIMSNISGLSVQYFSTIGSTTDLGAANAGSAAAISVTITSSQGTGGRNISTSASMRATKLNSTSAAQPAPIAPTESSLLVTPETAQFSWTTTANATSYEADYQINGGAWITQSFDPSTTSLSVTSKRGDVIGFRVAAVNATGQSIFITDSQTLPLWGTYTLQNGWVNFGSPYATPAFTKSDDGVVMLKGLIKSGTTTADTLIGYLPVGYRPTYRLIFQNLSGGTAGSGRVDILPTGAIQIEGGINSFFSLDGINFLSSGAGYTWTNLSLSNGWTNRSPPTFSPLRAAKDNTGRVHLEGFLNTGTYTTGKTIGVLPSGFTPNLNQVFSSMSDSAYNEFGVFNNTTVAARGLSSTWQSIQAMYYPAAFAGWTSLTLQNSWVVYNAATYETPQYTRSADDIVTLKGMIKSGTTTIGTVLATLPAGYRPLEKQIFTTDAGDALGRIDVYPTGDIVLQAGSATWTSLDAISFIAEQ